MAHKEEMREAPSASLDVAIVTFFFPRRIGGIEKFILRLAGALDRRVAVGVLAPRDGDSAEFDRDLPFLIIRKPMLAPAIFRNEALYKPLFPLLGALVFFWTFLVFRRRRPRMICSGSADFAAPVALAAQLLGTEFCFIAHGKDAHVRPGLFAHLAKRLPLCFAMRRSRVIFANSRFTSALLDPSGEFKTKIKILPVPIEPVNSVTLPAQVAAARAILESALCNRRLADVDILLSVGRLRERKGFQHVIAALELLSGDFPRLVHVIVGSGPFESELRREAQARGVADRVIFVGEHDPPEGFYPLAKIFASVSWPTPGEVEGFGMVYLEAARHGVPSIAGNSGGMPEAVIDGQTGLCVEGTSLHAIASAIRRLLSDETLRTKMGQAARQHAAAFTPEATAEQFLKLRSSN